MSQIELDRVGVSVRQVRRLLRRYRERGAAGLAWGHRTKASNNAFSEAFQKTVMDLVCEHYVDFGPTLAGEKLLERHGHRVSAETLRKWMIESGQWQSRERRRAAVSAGRASRRGAHRERTGPDLLAAS